MVRRYQPDYDGEPMLHCNYGPATDYTPDELTNLWAHYAAESEMVDRHLGRVLQKIDDLMLWDDTIVIVTSDHGTSLGEHNRTGKSNISDHDERYWPIYPGGRPRAVPDRRGAMCQPGKSLNLLAQPQGHPAGRWRSSPASTAPCQSRWKAGASRTRCGAGAEGIGKWR